MCFGCYTNEFGSPTLISPEIIRAADLCKRLYELPGGTCGGNCHIVTDDWNLEDENVNYCSASVDAGGWTDERTGEKHGNDPAQLKIERQLLDLMIPMTEAQRASALGLWEGFFKSSSGGIH